VCGYFTATLCLSNSAQGDNYHVLCVVDVVSSRVFWWQLKSTVVKSDKKGGYLFTIISYKNWVFHKKILIFLLTLWVPEFFWWQLKSTLVKFWLIDFGYLFTTYKDCHFENWVYPKKIIVVWDFPIFHSNFHQYFMTISQYFWTF
jgi:hypothetical protein